MPKRLLINTLMLSLAMSITPALADNCQTLDQQLATALINANNSSNYGDYPDEEKLKNANNQIDTIL